VKNVENRKNFFHLHLISDSTGETLISAGRAAAAQFRGSNAIEHVYPLIRSKKQIKALIDALDREPGIVLYTIVDQDLAALVETGCHELGLPCVNVLAPIIEKFQDYLGARAGEVIRVCRTQETEAILQNFHDAFADDLNILARQHLQDRKHQLLLAHRARVFNFERFSKGQEIGRRFAFEFL